MVFEIIFEFRQNLRWQSEFRKAKIFPEALYARSIVPDRSKFAQNHCIYNGFGKKLTFSMFSKIQDCGQNSENSNFSEELNAGSVVPTESTFCSKSLYH